MDDFTPVKKVDDYDVLADDTPKRGQIVYIPVGELFPHPDNPRKDLGDLTELTDSIKANGVLQNLTIVPGHRMTHEEWKETTDKYKENPTEELRHQLNNKDLDTGYTVVIGHRRLAAAKQAGLSELPCVISDMDRVTQISTMTLENMQRKSLTVYEEANAMQMLLDLGQSVYDIASQTGLSETTVRRRVKLLDLDKEKFKAAQERGATLADYVELEKITDPKLKNEVLDTIGTNDFPWKLKNAIATEEKKKKEARWIEIFNSFATQVKKKDDYKLVQQKWMGFNPDEEFTTPKDANEVPYFYFVNSGYIYLLKEKTEDEPVDPEAEEKKKTEEERVRRKTELEQLFKNAFELRKEFVSQYIGKKDDLPKLIRALIDFGDAIDLDDVIDILDIEICDDAYEDEYECIYGPEFSSECEKHPYKVLLSYLFACNDSENRSCYDYWAKYYESPYLARWYEFLESLGYQTSTEERQLLDGTHELYVKPEAE